MAAKCDIGIFCDQPPKRYLPCDMIFNQWRGNVGGTDFCLWKNLKRRASGRKRHPLSSAAAAAATLNRGGPQSRMPSPTLAWPDDASSALNRTGLYSIIPSLYDCRRTVIDDPWEKKCTILKNNDFSERRWSLFVHAVCVRNFEAFTSNVTYATTQASEKSALFYARIL